MNSAKTLLVVGVLGAIATGSYFVFNRPKPPEPPFEAWTERPKTDLGTIDDRNSTGTSDLKFQMTIRCGGWLLPLIVRGQRSAKNRLK